MLKGHLIVFITGLVFLLIGVACLIFPDKIQKYTIGLYTGGKGVAKLNPFIDWVRTSSYILTLRVIGITALLVFALALYIVLSKKF